VRVLLTTDCVGGVWTYSLDLARGLRSGGAEVVLATMGAPLRPEQRAEAESAGLVALHESRFALEWGEGPWTDVDAAGDWLLELAAAQSVDVVHSNSFAHGALAWQRPVVVVGHSCVVSWWRAVEGVDPPPEWDEYRVRVGAGLHTADAVVTPTAAMLRELDRAYGPTGGMAIANGSSVPESDCEKEPFILAAGRMWDRAKGLDLLDRAAAGLEWPVLAAGDGGSAAAVRALGRLSQRELAGLRQRASVFVAPARYEPFGLGILEAARAGCALVLADIPSLRELWAAAAVFVDPRDTDALHAELAQLTADAAARARLGRAAQMRARRYSVERMTRAYLALYARVGAPHTEVAA
jgi:glycosyltransferase involved in cell wall biosynthesis